MPSLHLLGTHLSYTCARGSMMSHHGCRRNTPTIPPQLSTDMYSHLRGVSQLSTWNMHSIADPAY
eukprot:6211780-Pleurochrysis_carterae.AAC.7